MNVKSVKCVHAEGISQTLIKKLSPFERVDLQERNFYFETIFGSCRAFPMNFKTAPYVEILNLLSFTNPFGSFTSRRA